MQDRPIIQIWKKISGWIFYIPVVFFFFPFLLFKYRLFVSSISTLNACFEYAGLPFDSRFSMLEKFTFYKDYLARSFLLKRDLIVKNFLPELYLKSVEINYPFVIKGNKKTINKDSKLILDESEFLNYINSSKGDLVLQEYLDYPLEYEIFWLKLFNGEGGIYSVTRKRHANKTNGFPPSMILENGGMDLRSKTLGKIYDICEMVTGFEYGSILIKLKNPESLSNGRDFKIFNVKGVLAGDTHIYDRKYSYYYRYKKIFKQWDLFFRIAKINQIRGFKSMSLRKMIELYFNVDNSATQN